MNCKRLLFVVGLLAAVVARASDVVWYDGREAVTYQVVGKASPVVDIALQMFRNDMLLVTGREAGSAKDATICIYELDKSSASVVKRLRAQGVPVDSLLGRHDAFYVGIPHSRSSASSSSSGRLQVKNALLVVGSNGRGTAYGILELSRLAGVSPWVWWGDVVPERRTSLSLPDTFATLQAPSVAYRGIFINDEDWSLRNWAWKHYERAAQFGTMGPKTYKAIFQLLLRLRANTIWPAMHTGTPGFFTIKGNKEMADSCGIVIGTSHCEPLLRNNVAEWNHEKRGAYNYMTNSGQVRQYWAERLKEVKGSEELFTIGMRGIHDGSMEGVKTKQEKLEGLQAVIDDQRELLRTYYDKDVERVPQVFIPYKEVLEILESGLRVPDDVTLMWCDDNYGYMTRLPDAEQQKRKGGGGVYYHLSYWGRPHDYLWLTTTQPGLIYSEMKAAYDHNCRKLWIANVHDPKVAAYDLELFLDMAWDINSVECRVESCFRTENLELRTERYDYQAESSELRTERYDYQAESSELRTERYDYLQREKIDSKSNGKSNHTSQLTTLNSQLGNHTSQLSTLNSQFSLNLEQHLQRWLYTQFGQEAGKMLFPAMKEFYRLCGIRKPEFMGWTQVELADRKAYPRGRSQVIDTEFSLTEFDNELVHYLSDYQHISVVVEQARKLIRPELKDAFFAHVTYPVEAARAMAVKMLQAQKARSKYLGQTDKDMEGREGYMQRAAAQAMFAYREIQRLTQYYNDSLAGGKWKGMMNMMPRDLPVFNPPTLPYLPENFEQVGYDFHLTHPVFPEAAVARNAYRYQSATEGVQAIQMLGHSMNAVAIPKGGEVVYEFNVRQGKGLQIPDSVGQADAVLYTAMIPTQPNDKGDLRYQVSLDDQEPVVISLKEKYRSDFWKQSVLRGQALKRTPVKVAEGRHVLKVKALDDHIIFDQWMIDFKPGRKFYVIPAR